MASIKSKLGLLIAGSYGLLAGVLLCLSFRSPQSPLLNAAVLFITAPWSIAVVLLGFFLIHLSTHGMDYGFIAGAVVNTLLLYVLGKKN